MNWCLFKKSILKMPTFGYVESGMIVAQSFSQLSIKIIALIEKNVFSIQEIHFNKQKAATTLK